MTIRTIAWRGVDDPGHLDTARVALVDGGGLRALGTSRAAEYVTAWSLDVDEAWITRRLTVHVVGDGWSRSLELTRSLSGAWASRGSADGRDDLPPPGLPASTAVDDLAGVLDVDLAFCPVTNLMPIRRLRLLEAPVEETALTVVWVDLPSLRVFPDLQHYSARADARGLPVVHFENDVRDLVVDLGVDDDGLVLDYPGIARRSPG